jgi:hypothetical protein
LFNIRSRDTGVLYNEGAVREYGGLVKFAEKGSSDSGSIDSEKTTLTGVCDEEMDLLLDQQMLAS